jgi:hypothetical protein
MMSLYCTASMLPCGRYYYAPEGGYVGNPWVKFSYQYAYLYMAWILHHLDLVEHYGFQYAHHLVRRHSSVKKLSKKRIETTIFSTGVNKYTTGKLTYGRYYAFMGNLASPIKRESR